MERQIFFKIDLDVVPSFKEIIVILKHPIVTIYECLFIFDVPTTTLSLQCSQDIVPTTTLLLQRFHYHFTTTTLHYNFLSTPFQRQRFDYNVPTTTFPRQCFHYNVFMTKFPWEVPTTTCQSENMIRMSSNQRSAINLSMKQTRRREKIHLFSRGGWNRSTNVWSIRTKTFFYSLIMLQPHHLRQLDQRNHQIPKAYDHVTHTAAGRWYTQCFKGHNRRFQHRYLIYAIDNGQLICCWVMQIGTRNWHEIILHTRKLRTAGNTPILFQMIISFPLLIQWTTMTTTSNFLIFCNV